MEVCRPGSIRFDTILIHIGNPTSAIQEIGPVEEKRDFVIVFYLAMLDAHQRCKYIGTDSYISNV